MANSRIPGPLCQTRESAIYLDGRTLCLSVSSVPGSVGMDVDDEIDSSGMGESSTSGDRRFEEQYSSDIEMAKREFATQINSWVESHWGRNECAELKPIKVEVSGNQ